MLKCLSLLLATCASLWAAAPPAVMARTIDGTVVEGTLTKGNLLPNVLSIHSGAPASDFESGRITAGLEAIQGKDRAARDRAVEELTEIGLPVLTPLLKAYKDTDQHEPRPLYRLFERIIPSYGDGQDRSLSLVRLRDGGTTRGALSDGSIEIKSADGKLNTLPWATIRVLAVRQKSVTRKMQVHALSHCTQIEFLDTGVVLTSASVVDASTKGFVRLSWETDSWATDANGLTKPGSPAYKSNLVDGQPFGALVGRVGANGENFFVGMKAKLTGKPAGRLRLAVNDNAHWQNNLGTFHVTMTATDAYDLGDAQ